MRQNFTTEGEIEDWLEPLDYEAVWIAIDDLKIDTLPDRASFDFDIQIGQMSAEGTLYFLKAWILDELVLRMTGKDKIDWSELEQEDAPSAPTAGALFQSIDDVERWMADMDYATFWAEVGPYGLDLPPKEHCDDQIARGLAAEDVVLDVIKHMARMEFTAIFGLQWEAGRRASSYLH